MVLLSQVDQRRTEAASASAALRIREINHFAKVLPMPRETAEMENLIQHISNLRCYDLTALPCLDEQVLGEESKKVPVLKLCWDSGVGGLPQKRSRKSTLVPPKHVCMAYTKDFWFWCEVLFWPAPCCATLRDWIYSVVW